MFYSALRGSSVKNVLEMTAYFFPSMWGMMSFQQTLG